MSDVLHVDVELPVEESVRSFHLYSPDLQDDPHAYFSELRQKCPVAHSDAFGGFWILSRYEDVHLVLQNHEMFSNTQMVIPISTFTRLGPDIPTQLDPPEHTRFRTILNPALSPAVIARLEDSIRGLAQRLLEPIVAKGRCDFLAEFAIPYPTEIFCDLMGLPKSELKTFLGWKDTYLRADTPEKLSLAHETVCLALEEYFMAVYDERHRQADPGDDLIGALIRAQVGGERPMTASEFIRMACLVWGAGLDTVTAQLSLAMLYLGSHLDKRDELVREPDLIPGAVEELIRYDTLVNEGRLIMKDTEIGGVEMKAGEFVMLLYASASRDPEQFPDADRVDFRRQPNRHLGFGAGVHRCVGSHLARTEMRIALEEIHRLIPTYRVDDNVRPVRHLGYVRGVDRLHLVL